MFTCWTKPCCFHVCPLCRLEKAAKPTASSSCSPPWAKQTQLCILQAKVWVEKLHGSEALNASLVLDGGQGAKAYLWCIFLLLRSVGSPRFVVWVFFFPSEISCTPAKLQSTVQALLSWSSCWDPVLLFDFMHEELWLLIWGLTNLALNFFGNWWFWCSPQISSWILPVLRHSALL